jgi:ferrochelatase
MAKQAVLLLAHGTPETIEQIPEYLRNVTGGRELPTEVVAEIQRRYRLIGHSPLTEITQTQAWMVEAKLAEAGEPVRVYVGMRNWQPTIAEAVKKMRAEGMEEVAAVCLAPQNSRTSVGLYRRALDAAIAAEAAGLRVDFTAGWANHPLLIEAFAERLLTAWGLLSAETGASATVLFTAHSVPLRTLSAAEGQPADSYASEARQTAALVAARLPRIGQWSFAFQSQGASGGGWIGPTVEETLASIAATGAKAVLLQPIGFVADHVEILYDVDIHFRAVAAGLGMRLERPRSLNGSPILAQAVAQLARLGLARLRS